MFSVFRITKAEFIKIFKKPSVYIMGIILALVVVFLMVGFSPIPALNPRTNITGGRPSATVAEMHEDFNTTTTADGKLTQNGKFENSIKLLDFYINVQTREEAISEALNKFLEKQNYLISVINSNSAIITPAFDDAKSELSNLISAFTHHYGLNNYEFYTIYKNSTVYSEFYNEDSGSLGVLNYFLQASQSNAEVFVGEYNSAVNANHVPLKERLMLITSNFVDGLFNEYINNIDTALDLYLKEFIQGSNNTYRPIMFNLFNRIRTNVTAFSTFYSSLTFSNENQIVLVSQQEYLKTLEFVAELEEVFQEVNSQPTNYQVHNQTSQTLHTRNLKLRLTNIKNKLIITSINLDWLEDFKIYLLNDVSIKSQNILDELAEYVLENATHNTAVARYDFNTITTKFKVLHSNVETYVNNLVNLNLLDNLSATQILTLRGYNDFNVYKLNEENAKIEYQLKTDTYINEYITPFTFNQNSSTETSFYDFMFYALKVTSIIIIIFVIIMASNIMAFEFDTGTIKLLAIRPFKRWKILAGKLLAVMFFVIVFVLFSSLISLVGGMSAFSYIPTAPVLAVFNSSVAFTISPIILIIAAILSTMLEVLFYAVIALSLSTIFRSFATAMSSSTIVLILGIVLNVILGASIWYSYIPFINIDMYRYLGSSFINNDNSVISLLLNNKLLSNSNFFISIAIYLGSLTVFMAASYLTFKKRDI